MESMLTAWATVLSAIFAGASALAAAWAIKVSISARANERLLAHAVTTLERGYAALANVNTSPHTPRQDRLAWLTCARLIEEYKSAKNRLADAVIIQECNSHEEHWRRQVYLLLEPLDLGHQQYYIEGEIAPVSAIIVNAFADWPEGLVDPIDTYSSKADAIEKLGVSKRRHSLRSFLGILN